jgi:RHS repeat-associated protein
VHPRISLSYRDAGTGRLLQVALASKLACALVVFAGLFGFLLSPSGASASVLPGKITENTTLAPAGNPYTGTSTIEAGVTVKVEPGVKLASGSLTVDGALLAEGTVEAPITFESMQIKFEPGSGTSVLDHVVVEHGSPSAGKGAIEINGSSPQITNSTIAHNYSVGINVSHGGSPEIASNNVFDSGDYNINYQATTGESGEVNIHGNLSENGPYGIRVIVTGSTVTGKTLGGNTIIKSQVPLTYDGPDIPGNITGNTLIENTSNVIGVSGTVAHSQTWNNGGVPVKIEGGVTVVAGETLTVTKGVLLRTPNLTVKGTLKAEGTAEAPVVFTGASEKSKGEWGSIKLEPGSGASVLDHTEVKYGGSGTSAGMIEVKGSSPRITNSTIRMSSLYGIKVTESGHPTIEWNRFRSNTEGLSYSGTGKLLAPNNDWGCASGPGPSGCGDTVTSNVEWKPVVQLSELNGQCRGTETQCGEGADPVSLATGQLSYSHRDLLLTNKSAMPLEFVRAYTSGSSSDTGLGPGWSQTGLASVTELESGAAMVLRQDGRQDLFFKTGEGIYQAPSGVTDTLAKVEGTFQLTTLAHSIYRFDSSGRVASITDDHGLKTTYGYNAEGRLATITDPSGQTLTFSYNGSNHITLVKDSTGREVKFAYSAAGDLETATDALGGVTKYVYDSQHRITSITDPRGNVMLNNTYDSQGRIIEQRDGLENLWKLAYGSGETTVTEPQGGKLTYGFDSQSRVVSEADQLGNKTTTVYDNAGNVSEVIRPGAAKLTFGHDSAGNPTSVKDPVGGERKYEFDAKNRLIKFTDARSNSWGYEWSAANDLTKITDPEGGETTLTYNESGQPLTITDADKHKTEFSYDTRGNRLSLTDPLTHKWSFGYDTRNSLTSITKPGVKVEALERNALGDLLARTTPEGHETKYAYDANGMPTQVTDPAEGVWKVAYNAMERPIAYTYPLGQEAKVIYNGNLRPTKVINRRGKETTFAYDLANRMTELHAPEGGNWSFDYDARGNRTSATDPREGKTTYEYDLLDRMTTAKEPLSVTSEYGYDPNGDLTVVKDPRGNTTAYGYDRLGRLIEVKQPLEKTTAFTYDGVGNMLSRATAAGTIEYGFDAADRLTSITSGESTLRSYGYDAANRLTEATEAEGHKIAIGYTEEGRPSSIGDGRGQSLTRSYDPRGLLSKQVDGRGTVEYGYDELGRMTSLTDPQGKAFGFAYDPEGDLTEVTRPNGVTTTNAYNDAGRLAETSSKTAEPLAVLESLKYGYDAAGNMTSKVDQRLEAETSYVYDALNRLTEFNPPGEGSTTYGYDVAGNRTAAGSTAYTFNALNQLTEDSTGTAYSYDGAGRLTGEVSGSEETTFAWDPLDHLAKAETSSGTVTYAFDALERLSERKEGEPTRLFHYGNLGDMPTYLTDGEGKTATSYVQGADGLVEQRSGEAMSFPLLDGHGDVTAIASGAGEVESRQSFDPWGQQLSGPGLEMGYLGAWERPTDQASGLIQMGARSYASALGSFLTEDPVYGHLGIGASVDHYLYVRDNPLNLYDLSGRDVCVPTPFGGACAEDAAEATWEHTGGAAWDETAGLRDRVGVAGDGNGGWLSEAPGYGQDRGRDFVKLVKKALPDIHSEKCPSLIASIRILNRCPEPEGALEYKESESGTIVPPIDPMGPHPSPGSVLPRPIPEIVPEPIIP